MFILCKGGVSVIHALQLAMASRPFAPLPLASRYTSEEEEKEEDDEEEEELFLVPDSKGCPARPPIVVPLMDNEYRGDS